MPYMKQRKKLFQGQVLDTIEATNEVDCWYQCTIHDGCQWFSYGSGYCLFLNDCPSLNEDLEDYISGQVECQFGSSTVPTTAKPTTPEPTTPEPTTAKPTTQEPTTPEPTTAEPTTAEPTTPEPTKAGKKYFGYCESLSAALAYFFLNY